MIPKDKKFTPERYGMIFCPDCNGLGRFDNDNEEIKVCRVCGGFGLIKKEEEIVLVIEQDKRA